MVRSKSKERDNKNDKKSGSKEDKATKKIETPVLNENKSKSKSKVTPEA